MTDIDAAAIPLAAQGVLVVGELNPDIVVTGVPAMQGKLRFGQAEDLVTSTNLTLGSSAAITASAVARAGESVSLVAVAGDDELGRMCLQWAAVRGIDVSGVRIAPGRQTGSSVILVSAEDAADRQTLTFLGTMAELRIEDLPDDLLARFAHLHVSSFFLHTAAREQLHERMAHARAIGASVSLDTNDDPEQTWGAGVDRAIEATDLLFCNDSEAMGLAGEGPHGDPERAVAALLDRMPSRPGGQLPAVVRKRGAAGATVHTRDGQVHVSAPAVPVLDTVGAGDTLAGTVIAALRTHSDWPLVLSLGVAAGSLSTTAAGGVAAQPSHEETVALAATLATHDQRTTTAGGPT